MKYSNAVLEIPSFQQDDTGGYECVAENKMGKNTATGRLAFYGTGTFVQLANTTQNVIYFTSNKNSIHLILDLMLLLLV